MQNSHNKIQKSSRIIAIDPGYERLGIAVLEEIRGQKIPVTLLFSECFMTDKKMTLSDRLCAVGIEVARIIEEYDPETLAIETLFFSKNQKTAMSVAEARGVIIYEGTRHGLKICQHSPAEIKIAITSHGKSDKKQMISMIPKLIKISKPIKYDDEYDAIATGITCLASKTVL